MTGARPGRWTGPLGLVALCTASFAAGEAALQALRYTRTGIAHGQWWRLVTCGLVHLNGWHLLQDVAGLLLLGALVPRSWSAAGWLVRLGWTTAGMSALLWWGWPQVDAYAGLSGPLYGLCVIALWPAARGGDRLAAGAIAVLGLGIAAELVVGSPAPEERLIGGHVVAESHLAGAVAGLGWIGVQALWQVARRRRTGGRAGRR